MTKRITGIKAINYMKEWLHYTSVKKIDQDEEFLYFTARNQTGNITKIKVNIVTEVDSWEIYEKDDNGVWQWIDAIPVN
ncbi:hypothetical protein BSK59_13150 [Paenibacillus odorifer]|uniref:hypothetical protein n=1 Tax=Paenibacillus odorifer TaxID=189426 RepID=UPI00096F5DB4|nr:hypothetical protein [Paenibacillus odorifer]OME55419.1 hypothetical protein BSK59_13150 [Paenibacillus odorifer]